MNKSNIDKELESGVVNIEFYKKMLDAEVYGTATPMQWLISKLSIIKNLIKSGIAIKYDTGYESGILDDEKKFLDWCEKNFPTAHACMN